MRLLITIVHLRQFAQVAGMYVELTGVCVYRNPFPRKFNTVKSVGEIFGPQRSLFTVSLFSSGLRNRGDPCT